MAFEKRDTKGPEMPSEIIDTTKEGLAKLKQYLDDESRQNIEKAQKAQNLDKALMRYFDEGKLGDIVLDGRVEKAVKDRAMEFLKTMGGEGAAKQLYEIADKGVQNDPYVKQAKAIIEDQLYDRPAA